MRSAVTICLVPEARQGPFVFHEGLDAGCRAAAELGFDAVEIFPGSAADIPVERVLRVLGTYGLAVAAVGTGAGWIRQGLHLCHPEASVRARAREFIASVVDLAAELGAPAIVGSMQGRTAADVPGPAALDHLAGALSDLGERAARRGQVLLYEPLNRYETDLFNRQADAAGFLRSRGLGGVRLLCDLFHAGIEEADPAAAIVGCGDLVGHVHWADSNRRAMGFGHADPRPVVAALRAIGYEGYLSAEVLPLPTPQEAARRTIDSLRELGVVAPRPPR